MKVHLDVPDSLAAAAVDAALIGLQGIAELDIASTAIPWLYESGVVYDADERDPETGKRAERWLSPSRVLYEGRADCEDLAAWRAAELRVSGEDTSAQAIVVRSGPRLWHAVVARDGGSWIEDPSAYLGLRLPGGARAPARFAIELDGPRDYRGIVVLEGDGHGLGTSHRDREAPYAVGCCLGVAEDAAMRVGILPIVGPALELITSIVDAATGNGKRTPAAIVDAGAQRGITEAELAAAIEKVARQVAQPTASTMVVRRKKRRTTA